MIISCLEFWNEFLLSTRRTHNVALASDCQLCDTDYRSVWFFFFFFCCVSWWPMKSIHSKWLFQGAVTAQTLGLHPVVCVMLVINQPVGQTDTNQPQTSSHPAWLPISEMAGTTHKMPSAQHFISKCLYHLCACLVYTWWTFGGVGQAIRFWHYGASLVSRDLMFFLPTIYDLQYHSKCLLRK